MVDTWCISNDQGWSRISLSLSDCFNGLVEVSTHCDLSYIDISICHSHSCKVFLLCLFSTCCELCCSTGLCSLGGLSTCIRINLCIKYHDIDILLACKHMVNTAVSDIVSPSVSSEDPLGLLSQEIFVLQNICLILAVTVTCFQSSNQLVCSCSVCSSHCICLKIFICCSLHCLILCLLCDLLNLCFQSVSDCILGK